MYLGHLPANAHYEYLFSSFPPRGGGERSPRHRSSNSANIKVNIKVLKNMRTKKQATKGMIVMLVLDGGESG